MPTPDSFLSTESGGRDLPIVKWLNEMFIEAVQHGVSDVHFEDEEQDVTRLRWRINGKLSVADRITRGNAIAAQTKILSRAGLPSSDHREPLDGRFFLRYPEHGISVDVRVSFAPTIHGRSVVCRILDQKNTTRTLDQIEMKPAVRQWIEILLREPYGLFLVTGPTGSGKTSTLYALLNALHTIDRKIVTIEDPVEYRVDGLCQTNIEGKLTFADALRAELRQDPDIILVGEIRDAETAAVAVQAAMTGHLVLSTLHTNDAPSAIARLLDLGVDPNTLSAALRGVLAQRLVRRLADNFEWVKPSETEVHWLSSHKIEEIDCNYGSPIVGEGDGEGYNGRIAVMELIVVDRTMRNVLPLNDVKLIHAVARKQPQYETLAQCAADYARRGVTGIAELFTVSSISEHLQTLRTVHERLIELGKLTPYQYEVCKELQQEASRAGKRLALEEILISQRYCTQEDIDEVQSL